MIKRRIREAYRLNKYLLPASVPAGAAEKCGGTDILFIYSSKEIMTQSQITSMMVSVLKNVSPHE